MNDANEPFPYDKQAEEAWKTAGEEKKGPGAGLRRITVNPLDYHTPGPGKEGGTATGRVTLGTKHLMNVIVASKETPFDTPGELVRAAVVWYLNEIAPSFRNGRIAQGLKELHDYIEDSGRDALSINIEKMQNVSKDRITRLIRIGADLDAAFAYRKMLRVAYSSHPKFGRVMQQWAESEAAFEKIRVMVKNIEEREKPTDQSLCRACGHTRIEHDGKFVSTTDSESTTAVCRGAGFETVGKGKKAYQVAGCHCEVFDWQEPPTQEELDL